MTDEDSLRFLVGYDEQGNAIFTQFSSLAEYLVERTGVWERLKARVMKVYLGKFRLNIQGASLTDYYLSWCSKHQRFFANYKHGHAEDFFCPDCENERLVQIRTRIIRSQLASRAKS